MKSKTCRVLVQDPGRDFWFPCGQPAVGSYYGQSRCATHFPALESLHAARQTGLTERQWEVAEKVTEGLADKEIAVALGVSHGAVKNHLASIYSKLRLPNRTALAAWFVEANHRRKDHKNEKTSRSRLSVLPGSRR